MKCPHQESNLGRRVTTRRQGLCLLYGNALPSASGHFLHRVSDRRASRQTALARVAGSTPPRHFFFFRLDLPARPALNVILPWLCMQGPVA